jgi:hypothetical protein
VKIADATKYREPQASQTARQGSMFQKKAGTELNSAVNGRFLIVMALFLQR